MTRQDESLSHDIEVFISFIFSVKQASIQYELPEDFLEMIPKKTNSDNLIQKHSLSVAAREPIIQYIFKNFQMFRRSGGNSQFGSIICLQSFSAILIDDIADLPSKTFTLFINTLLLCQKHYPVFNKQFQAALSLYYRVTADSKICVRMLDSVSVAAVSVSSMIAVPLKTHLVLSSNALMSIFSDFTFENIQIFSSFTPLLHQIFYDATFDESTKRYVNQVFRQATQCLMQTTNSSVENLHEFQSSAIFLCLVLSYVSHVSFPNFFAIHEQISVPYPVVPSEIPVSKPGLIQVIESVPMIEFPSYLTVEQNLPHFYKHFFKMLFDLATPLIKFVYDLFIEILYPVIPTSLEAHRFNLLFLFHLHSFQVEKIAPEEKQLFSVLFPPILFNPDFSCFDDPLPNIVIIRKLSFDCFHLFYPVISDCIFIHFFIPLLSALSSEYHLYSEVMLHMSSSIKFTVLAQSSIDAFFSCLSSQVRLQLDAFPPHISCVTKVRGLFFATIESFLSQFEFVRSCNESNDLIQSFIEVVYDANAEKQITSILSFLLSFASPDQTIIKQLAEAICKSKNNYAFATRLILILKTGFMKKPEALNNSIIMESLRVFVESIGSTNKNHPDFQILLLTIIDFHKTFKLTNISMANIFYSIASDSALCSKLKK